VPAFASVFASSVSLHFARKLFFRQRSPSDFAAIFNLPVEEEGTVFLDEGLLMAFSVALKKLCKDTDPSPVPAI
jgi:hypothetical protein